MSVIDSGLGIGIGASVRRAAKSFADQATLHGELFWVEWQAERTRIVKIVILWLIGLVLASFTLVFLSLSALAAAWDTPYRLHVGLGLSLIYLIGFIVTRVYLRGLAQQPEGAFVATRQQLAEEAEFLKSLL